MRNANSATFDSKVKTVTACDRDSRATFRKRNADAVILQIDALIKRT